MALLASSLAIWDDPSTSMQGAQRYDELAVALKLANGYLAPRDVSTTKGKQVETPEITAAIGLILKSGRGSALFQDFMDAVDSKFYLVKRDIQRFISRIEESSVISILPHSNPIMVEMLERLAIWQRAWGVPLRVLNDPKLIHSFTSTFHHLLHCHLPETFPSHLETFLTSSLASLPAHLSNPPHNEQILQTVPINYQRVSPPSVHLSRLGVLPRYSASLSKVAYDEIERIAKEEAARGWSVRCLTRARQKVGDGVANWLSGMFDAALRPMFSRFDYYLCKCFFDIRTDELFSIIVDFPDSLAALEDLKECLFKVDQRSVLVDKLKAANVKRLLHPGAETKDLITQYISTIRCLRILDPQGVLLHKIAGPIRKHLRERTDTIRCLVATLVEGEELGDENEPTHPGIGGSMMDGGNYEGVEDFLDPKWDPEPVDAAPAGDIISTLVSIYESRDVIIKELQVLLATRLLAVKDYDAVKEVRTIELLKLRFGDAALQVCDVMIKDMADSKRIDEHVQGDIKSAVHPLIISQLFWPNIQSSSLKLPPKLQTAQEQYESAFHKFKPDKRLRWLQQIGTATIKLELSDRVVEVEANPVQASIAELFEEMDVWTVEDLSTRLGLRDLSVVRNALGFWGGLGVLKDEGVKGWRLLEVAEEGSGNTAFVEEVPVLEQVEENKTDQIRVHWQYIKGILTNLGPQPVEKIQSMLGFIDDYEQSLEELEAFLAAARREGMVDLRIDGWWVLLEGV